MQYISYKLYILFVEDYVLDNIFVENILYEHAYLWIRQYLYYECMLYIMDLCLKLLSIIKIGHDKIVIFHHFSFCNFLSGHNS
jgi:hypothetical protein